MLKRASGHIELRREMVTIFLEVTVRFLRDRRKVRSEFTGGQVLSRPSRPRGELRQTRDLPQERRISTLASEANRASTVSHESALDPQQLEV